jgi:hypothetical protein
MTSFTDQIRRNSVALISLVVALSSLAYNTWRNEQTESNRNVRVAGMQLLLKLGELEKVVFFAHYDKGTQGGNPRAAGLVEVWQENWSGLGASDEAASKISDSIDTTRNDVLQVLAQLD